MAKQNNETGPDWRPPDWVRMQPIWQKIKDVRDALSTDDLKATYLKQALGERDTSYLIRVELSEMGEDFEDTIKSNTGLLSKFDLSDETPQTLQDNKQNVDLAGTNLRQYVAQAIASAFANECVLLGCHTQLKETAGGDRRPYLSIVSIPDSAYSPRTEVIDDELVLTQIAIKSAKTISKPNGFGYSKQAVFLVYRLQADKAKRIATVQEYVLANKEQGQYEATSPPRILTTANGREQLSRLPFIWLALHPQSRVGKPGRPPFLSLAEKLIKRFNQVSELDAIQRKTNIPIPTQEHSGEVPEEPDDIIFGTDNVWHHAKDTKVGFAEPTGSSMAIAQERIEKLSQEIRAQQEKFLGINENRTATAALIDAGQVEMTLETIKNAVESSFQELFKLWALLGERTYKPGDDAGGITINLDMLKPRPTLQDVQTVPALWELGGFNDIYEAQAVLWDIGYLSDDVMNKAKELREKAEEDGRLVNAQNPTIVRQLLEQGQDLTGGSVDNVVV